MHDVSPSLPQSIDSPSRKARGTTTRNDVTHTLAEPRRSTQKALHKHEKILQRSEAV